MDASTVAEVVAAGTAIAVVLLACIRVWAGFSGRFMLAEERIVSLGRGANTTACILDRVVVQLAALEERTKRM